MAKTREQEKAECKELLSYWNSKDIIKHDLQTAQLEMIVRCALIKHGMAKIKTAIDRYATAFHDAEYYQCEYAWSLAEFIKNHSGAMQYFDDGEKWVNYCRYKQGFSNSGNEPGEYQKVLSWLKSLPYLEYLKTEHWQHFRVEALIFFGNKCQQCESTKKTKVHHKTYKNRGRETFNDVTVLCDKCHRKEHGI